VIEKRFRAAAAGVAVTAVGVIALHTSVLPAAQAQSGHRLCFSRFLLNNPDGTPATDVTGPALFEAKEITKDDDCGPLHDGNREEQHLTGDISENRWKIREEDVSFSYDSMDIFTTCEDFGGAADKLAGLTPLNHANDGWITPDVCRNMDVYRTWWFYKHKDAGGRLILESLGPGTPT
jgi:hypothetical protein